MTHPITTSSPKSQVQTDVELRLRGAAIPALTGDELKSAGGLQALGSGVGMLFVRVVVVKSLDEATYAYSALADLVEEARLIRDPSSSLRLCGNRQGAVPWASGRWPTSQWMCAGT